jgi:4-amino-4-deoxy-L-arabinose transferase-like glycosyltransferase
VGSGEIAAAGKRSLNKTLQQRIAVRNYVLEVLLVLACCAFFFYYGLGAFGLVGADEPRYAQVAREMLMRHDMITPTLHGEPWLEKPALYYWRAMLSFHEFGVKDWAARLPSATFATMMVIIIYFHMRRFRPGAQLDAALITASCAAVIGFARGASTDMQLAAPFALGMLGWYAWYETGRKFWLFDIYFFIGVATLAKGPVAPFLGLVIVAIFAGVKREWRLILRSWWWPGALTYFAIVLPWFILVQLKNPQFLRVFILEHNLERFGSDVYRHTQPFWYYIPVFFLSVAPWTFFAIPALVEAFNDCVRDWRSPHTEPKRLVDSFPEFLVIWTVVPIVFFSISRSKLPGYILPAIAPCAILTADHILRHRRESISRLVIICHAVLVGFILAMFLLFPQKFLLSAPPGAAYRAVIIAIGAAVAVFIYLALFRRGYAVLRPVTLIPVVLIVAFILRVAAPTIDDFYSARPVAREISELHPQPAPVAVFKAKRELEYGLGFYRDQTISNYDVGEIPAAPHILVARSGYADALAFTLRKRHYIKLGGFAPQRLDLYWVDVAPGK